MYLMLYGLSCITIAYSQSSVGLTCPQEVSWEPTEQLLVKPKVDLASLGLAWFGTRFNHKLKIKTQKFSSQSNEKQLIAKSISWPTWEKQH